MKAILLLTIASSCFVWSGGRRNPLLEIPTEGSKKNREEKGELKYRVHRKGS